jgi:hypothetical protein
MLFSKYNVANRNNNNNKWIILRKQSVLKDKGIDMKIAVDEAAICVIRR